MKFFLLFPILFLSTLFAANPSIYAALGDKLYDNAFKVKNLKQLSEYKPFEQKIDDYLDELEEAKKLGFAIEKGERPDAAKAYLEKLRKLAKTNDFFLRSANAVFEKGLQKGDVYLVMMMLDLGIVDAQRYKRQLLDFYNRHKGSFTPEGVYLELLRQEAKKNAKMSDEEYAKLKRLKEQEKIKKLRKKDKERQEELQKRLEQELKMKKRQIEKEQLRQLRQEELSN